MNMAVVKNIEIIAESEESWEAAAQAAIDEAAKTIKNINQVYIDYFKGVVENNKIVRYSVNTKISFVVKD
jgi:flavin-binding protein dodecin